MANSKVAVVSGANRGLGLGTAEALAREGFTVWMLGRDKGKIEAAAEGLAKQGLKVKPFQADVSKAEDVARAAKAIGEAEGKVDVLVNNAGVFLNEGEGRDRYGSVLTVDPKKVLATFEINTLGALRLTQALLALLRESGDARVVNVSSGMGGLAEMNGGSPGYRLSKTALNALTRIFSEELAQDGIKVNSVCPGWVKTDMGGEGAYRELPEGVKSIVWAALIPKNGPTGGFFRDGKPLAW